MPSMEQENTLSFSESCCKLGRQCPVFARFVNSNDRQRDVIDHCLKQFHPGRRGGMTVEENFGSNKFVSAYQNCNKPRAHQPNRNFWCGKVNDGDLEKEVIKNDLEHRLTLDLHETVKEKEQHNRHRQMGSPLSYTQILAVVLYTNYGEFYNSLNADERTLSAQNVTDDNQCIYKQKWPVFGRALNFAICCLNKYDCTNRPTTVYRGLHGIVVDGKELKNVDYGSRTKKNDFFKCGSFFSTSSGRNVALGFASPDSNVANPSSIFEIDATPDEYGNELIGADVSWLSRFSDEEEYLIARLAQFGVNGYHFVPDINTQTVKLSVEFFCHRGQMCYSLEHDSKECNCEIKVGPRPEWMPPPVSLG